MAEKACKDNGYKVDPKMSEFFSVHRKTHNAGVFDVYTPEMRAFLFVMKCPTVSCKLPQSSCYAKDSRGT